MHVTRISRQRDSHSVTVEMTLINRLGWVCWVRKCWNGCMLGVHRQNMPRTEVLYTSDGAATALGDALECYELTLARRCTASGSTGIMIYSA